jgi:hypothetical protein
MPHSSSGDGKSFPFSLALRHALVSADAAHRASLDVLRDAICEYVEDLRDQGVSVDDIAGAIRRRVVDFQSAGGIAALRVGVDGIVDDIVTSCLDSS